MPYATTQNFIDTFSNAELVQLTNLWDATATTINTANLQKNQDRAFSLINAHIASNTGNAQYLPFASPYPELLITLECDITWYYLWKSQATQDVRDRYEDAMKLLSRIAKGEIKLGLNSATPQTVLKGSNLPQVLTEDRVFTKESLSDFNIGY